MHSVTVLLAEDPKKDPQDKWFNFELPYFKPHEVLAYMFDEAGVEVQHATLQRYWDEARQSGIPWALKEDSELRIPVKFFADDAQINDQGDKVFSFVISCPLFRPKSARNSKWPVAIINLRKSLGWATLRPVLGALVHSLNVAYDTATSKGFKFQVTEIGMDWKAAREMFNLRSHWNSPNLVCHMCRMTNTGYHLLPNVLQWRTTVDLLTEVLHTDNVTPLVLLRNFEVSCITWCSLHNLNLGILWTINGGSLAYLLERDCYGNLAANGFDACLKTAYKDFKEWQARVKIRCSQRPFTMKMLFKASHGAYLTAKGYNSRVITAYLADKTKLVLDACPEPVPPELLLQSHCLFHTQNLYMFLGFLFAIGSGHKYLLRDAYPGLSCTQAVD